jgi:hypothetical protein
MKPIKSQSALEYLMIIAIALGVIIPTSYFFFKFTSISSEQAVDSQITQIGKLLMDTVETVYYSGEDSKIILEVNIPKGVTDANILAGRELVFELDTKIGKSELIFLPRANIPLASDDPTIDCSNSIVCDLSDLTGEGLKIVEINFDGTINKVIIKESEN